MDHVKDAINFAVAGQVVDFKTSILSALQDKVQDALHLKKMEIGSHLLAEPEEIDQEQETDQSDQEENVDENL
jgi:hypothetical protein